MPRLRADAHRRRRERRGRGREDRGAVGHRARRRAARCSTRSTTSSSRAAPTSTTCSSTSSRSPDDHQWLSPAARSPLHIDRIAKRRGWDVEVRPLPPELHNRPERIRAAVDAAGGDVVAYADCGTRGALDDLPRLPGADCYQLFGGMEHETRHLLPDRLPRAHVRPGGVARPRARPPSRAARRLLPPLRARRLARAVADARPARAGGGRRASGSACRSRSARPARPASNPPSNTYSRRPECSSTNCRATRSSTRRRCRSSTAAGAASSPSSASTSCTTRRSPPSRPSGQKVEGQLVKFDPDWILEQVAKAPREFDLQARNPEHSIHIGGKHMAFGAVYGCPFVREGIERREATLRRLREPRPPLAGVPAARHPGRDDLRAERQAARLPPSRHGLRADDAVGQAVHGLRHLGAERARHDRDGRDGVRARVARARRRRSSR